MHGGSKLAMRRTAHQMPLIERVGDSRIATNNARLGGTAIWHDFSHWLVS
jgi:hypothetical protein